MVMASSDVTQELATCRLSKHLRVGWWKFVKERLTNELAGLEADDAQSGIAWPRSSALALFPILFARLLVPCMTCDIPNLSPCRHSAHTCAEQGYSLRLRGRFILCFCMQARCDWAEIHASESPCGAP